MSTRLLEFTAELLDHCGAAVEPVEPEGLETLLPDKIQALLNLPEEVRLGFSNELPEQAQRVSLESDWMERLGKLLSEDGRQGACVWKGSSIPPASPEKLLKRTLQLENAVYHLQNVQPTYTRYLVLQYRHTAVSDEKREGLIQIGFNLANGAILDEVLTQIPDPMRPELTHGTDGQWEDTSTPENIDLPALWPQEQVDSVVERALPERVRAHLKPFIQGLERRQERDLKRLRDYHSDLGAEAGKRLTTALRRAEPEDKKEINLQYEKKLTTIAREYQAKVRDLQHKYAMTVRIEWIQSLTLTVPVYRFNLLIKRRKGERAIFLDWNPVARKLEYQVCEASFSSGPVRMVCDKTLHLVAPAAHAKCAQCSKPFCRACHPKTCPKCHSRVSGIVDPNS